MKRKVCHSIVPSTNHTDIVEGRFVQVLGVRRALRPCQSIPDDIDEENSHCLCREVIPKAKLISIGV